MRFYNKLKTKHLKPKFKTALKHGEFILHHKCIFNRHLTFEIKRHFLASNIIKNLNQLKPHRRIKIYLSHLSYIFNGLNEIKSQALEYKKLKATLIISTVTYN